MLRHGRLCSSSSYRFVEYEIVRSIRRYSYRHHHHRVKYFCSRSEKPKGKKTNPSEDASAERRRMQMHYMRNPPTMLKIFNPELYMDPNSSRTWKIVGGSWVIVFTTLGLMYLKERFVDGSTSPASESDINKTSQGRSNARVDDYTCDEKW